MSLFKILVLTDHSSHSHHNSIYALLSEMLDHNKCQCIDVVSRGLEENQKFFTNFDASRIFGSRINKEFEYNSDGYYFKKDLREIKINDYDIIFMRLPRPISDEWLKWMAGIAPSATFINHPLGIIKTSNKKYLLNFPDLSNDMKLCHTKEEIQDISKRYPVVLKPLKEYGGKGIVKIDENRVHDGDKYIDFQSYLKTIETELETDGYLAMKYLKNVSKGDKRILVVGGQIMASSLRIPADGSWLCNVSQGGKSVKTEVTVEEELIVNTISPSLIAEGIMIFGVDTLEDDDGKRILSEVNTLSVGGFPQAQKQSQRPIIKMTIDKIFKYADQYR